MGLLTPLGGKKKISWVLYSTHGSNENPGKFHGFSRPSPEEWQNPEKYHGFSRPMGIVKTR